MLNTPFAPWPCFTQEEADAVNKVLLSNRVNYWTGDQCRTFERVFAEWTGSAHAIALANGTVALDLALHGLGVGAANGGDAADEVVVAPRTFIASASCVANAGAVPVFSDVEPESGNISAESIAAVLTPRTKAIIVVHLGGWPADMDPIMALAHAHGIKVIEDCAQAHGARYKGRSVGSIGDVGAWSFCQDKIMTTGGEGGMVTCNDKALWSRMWSFKDHGKSWEAVYERAHPPGPRLVHDTIGTNWRMIEMQAAIGLVQLARMEDWTARRTRHAARIAQACEAAPTLHVPALPTDISHAWYRFYAFVRAERLAPGWSRDRIIEEIVAMGIPCYHGSASEVYLEDAFDHPGWRPVARLPNAHTLGKTSIAFLVHPTLTDEQIEQCCAAIGHVTQSAAG